MVLGGKCSFDILVTFAVGYDLHANIFKLPFQFSFVTCTSIAFFDLKYRKLGPNNTIEIYFY